jgi:hypothetical protein
MAGLNLAQLRYHLGTFGYSDGAMWMEDAPRRWVQRAGYLPAQFDVLPVRLHLWVWNRYRRQ